MTDHTHNDIDSAIEKFHNQCMPCIKEGNCTDSNVITGVTLTCNDAYNMYSAALAAPTSTNLRRQRFLPRAAKQKNPCLGSENVLLTDKGTVKLKDLKFSDGATVILTTEHLLYDEANNLVRADAVSVGDVVFGGETIVNIETVMDIPLTPCVVEGLIDIQGKSISCWAGNAENARKMQVLCGKVQDAMDQAIPIDVIAKMAHDVYEKYHASGKDLSIMHAEATEQKDQYFSNTEVLLKKMIAV